jgi:hypothetical protein
MDLVCGPRVFSPAALQASELDEWLVAVPDPPAHPPTHHPQFQAGDYQLLADIVSDVNTVLMLEFKYYDSRRSTAERLWLHLITRQAFFKGSPK